jgi:hypothetical protein
MNTNKRKARPVIWDNTVLDTETVIHELQCDGTKMLISNDKITTQVSWAPDNRVEFITISNKTNEVRNQFFMEFKGMETINYIKKSFPSGVFRYGYLED